MTTLTRKPDVTENRLEMVGLAIMIGVAIVDVVRWRSHASDPVGSYPAIAASIGSAVFVRVAMFRLIRRRMPPR